MSIFRNVHYPKTKTDPCFMFADDNAGRYQVVVGDVFVGAVQFADAKEPAATLGLTPLQLLTIVADRLHQMQTAPTENRRQAILLVEDAMMELKIGRDEGQP